MLDILNKQIYNGEYTFRDRDCLIYNITHSIHQKLKISEGSMDGGALPFILVRDQCPQTHSIIFRILNFWPLTTLHVDNLKCQVGDQAQAVISFNDVIKPKLYTSYYSRNN